MDKVLVLNCVGLTPDLIKSGSMPVMQALAESQEFHPLTPPLPAVTCTAQASMLTGQPPAQHGAIANGWYFRNLSEILFWKQSVNLLEGPTVFEKWRASRPASSSAQMFWWWNLPSKADISVTPRPTYWANGRKSPDIHANPPALRKRLNERLGTFPLFNFWGPGADIRSTQWIANAIIDVLKEDRPGLCLGYLPHLDYDIQRFGPKGPEALQAAAQLDQACSRLLDVAKENSYEILVVSEYGINQVHKAIHLNRLLRKEGWLKIHPAKNGALLDPGNSRAFAVCDHQCAHVYIANSADIGKIHNLLSGLEGVGNILDSTGMASAGLNHARSGELFLLAEHDYWFAYPYWEGGDQEPDFARTVDIHRKPGYDPCELFLSPAWPSAKLSALAKVAYSKMGVRVNMDIVPLDTDLVKGSHGIPPRTESEGPVWIGPPQLLPQLHQGKVRAEDALSKLI
ncbi:MAG TPA: alkaline phosphatase family protein [Planctomycetes bacterium]|nr:alkaline phosphatase family protein [Planctomycetota bacterium]